MKVRWRKHEFIGVSIITAITVAGYIWESFLLRAFQIKTLYAGAFISHHELFNYYRNRVLPQISQPLLAYCCYLLIIRFIVPLLRTFHANTNRLALLKKTAFIAGWVILISYLLALGINIATWYARPYYYNYGGFSFLSLFGYNDKPLTDLFAGFDRAVAFIMVFVLLAGFRELVIHYIEKPGCRKPLRTLIANKITAFLVIYFSIPVFLVTFRITEGGFLESAFATIYFAFILPAFLVFVSNTYWIFPLKSEHAFPDYRMIGRVLLSSFLYTLFAAFCFVFIRSLFVFMISWVAQLLIVSPVSWLFYKQRKDRILQLRGMEKALEKSKADLQFLRSQLNPHFLFNALNTLYGTALQEGSEHTAAGIQQLGDMMRFMLHDNNLDFIPMSREIEYLLNYIALQKLRIQSSPGIRIEDHISGQNCNHPIAPMLLIPMVENAFKHGISLTNRSWVSIRLACSEQNIHFEVSNSMHRRPDDDPEKYKSGIGLKNVAERLALLYPGKHTFHAAGDGTQFMATLDIQP